MKTESSKTTPQTTRSRKLIPETWDVPEVFRRRLGDSVGRQRAMVAEGHLLMVLHEPPKADDEIRDARLFWRNPQGEWTINDTTGQIRSLHQHLEQYDAQMDKLEKMEEQASTADVYFELLSELTVLYRAARNQHVAFQEAREAIDSRDLINFRDRCYMLERMAELLQSDAKNALDLTIARRAEEQADTSYHMAVSAHRLNVLVAFFFPIATLCAIFGTNLDTGLEHMNPPYPFLATIGSGMAIGIVLKFLVTRKPARPSTGQS